jgi:hypothetical protein
MLKDDIEKKNQLKKKLESIKLTHQTLDSSHKTKINL